MLRAKAIVAAAAAVILGAGLFLSASVAAAAGDHAGGVTVQDPKPGPDSRSGKQPKESKESKAGNNAAARLCAQGGYQARFDAVTGSGFPTSGACVAHAAAGGSQAMLKLTATVYPCEATPSLNCWGVVGGSGLQPDSPVTIIGPEGQWQVSTVDASGTLSAAAQISCDYRDGDAFTARTYIPIEVVITTHPQVYTPCGTGP